MDNVSYTYFLIFGGGRAVWRETNLTYFNKIGFSMPNLVVLALKVFEILFIQTDRQTVGHGYIDSAIDADQEYMYFVGSMMLPFPCYILCKEHNIPLYLLFN